MDWLRLHPPHLDMLLRIHLSHVLPSAHRASRSSGSHLCPQVVQVRLGENQEHSLDLPLAGMVFPSPPGLAHAEAPLLYLKCMHHWHVIHLSSVSETGNMIPIY